MKLSELRDIAAKHAAETTPSGYWEELVRLNERAEKAEARLAKIEEVCRSLLSEVGMTELVTAYVRGMELISLLEGDGDADSNA